MLDINEEIAVVSYEPDDEVKEKKNVTLTTEVIPFYLEKLEAIAQENNGHLALGKVRHTHFISDFVYDIHESFSIRSWHGPICISLASLTIWTTWPRPIWLRNMLVSRLWLKMFTRWSQSRPGWRSDHQPMFKWASCQRRTKTTLHKCFRTIKNDYKFNFHYFILYFYLTFVSILFSF